MTREQVYVLLTDVFRDVLCDDGIVVSDATRPDDLPGCDSLARVEVLAAAEVRFGVEIRAADADRLATVGDLVDLILGKVPSLALI